jgi:hypothetical protein
MSYNGSGTFQINTSGQPVVAGTVISSTAFNALTADLATGLSTAITKDGQTTTTARIPFAQGINSSLATDSSSTSTGSIITAGGVGIVKNLYVGANANIAGTLSVTGSTTLTNPVINNIKMGYTTTATAAGTTTLTVSSNYRQFFTGSTTQTVVLPVTSTLVTGMAFEIENNSTGLLTVNSSGGNLVGTVPAGVCAHAVCIGTTLTTAADWDWDYISTTTITGTGANVLGTSPTITSATLVTPALGTPASGSLVNCTDLNYTGFKNRIINGAMVIDQRNAGASVTPANSQYTLDRFVATLTQASKFTVQQNAGSVTPPVGFTKYLGVTSSSAYSVLTGDTFAIVQYIEGFNIADLAYGTASAATVTLSFQVRSSLTGTFGGALVNGAQNRSYPFTYTISAANTWESKSITIVGDTTGTWTTDNSAGLGVRFGLGSGATYTGTAGAWAAGNYLSATGATSVVGTNGATFYITGVQLEKGSTATSFDYRPYGTELNLCQRYCQYAGSGASGSFDGSTTVIQIMEKCVVTMRAAPSGAIYSGVTAAFRSVALDFTAASPALANFLANTSNVGGTSFWTQVSGFTGGTSNAVVTARNNQAANGGNFILLTSEL